MSSIFDSILTDGFSVGLYLLCLLFAGLCGGIAALALSRESAATRSFLISLVVLPIAVTTVVLMVNGNVGTGIAVAGAFSLVRFRSAPGTGREIAAVFVAMAIGLACGMGCVGLAANMIGIRKCIIAVSDNGIPLLMYNPYILDKSGPFDTEEGCLSLDGVRPTTRYRKIRVRYSDERFVERTRQFTGWTAQIIQHEVDHCNGIII